MLVNREGGKTLASEARHWVHIQRVVPVSDGAGGYDEELVTVKSCWASISPIRAKQRFEYKGMDVDATHYMRFRGYTEIQEKDKILIKNSRVLEVLTVENLQERDFEKFVVCQELRK